MNLNSERNPHNESILTLSFDSTIDQQDTSDTAEICPVFWSLETPIRTSIHLTENKHASRTNSTNISSDHLSYGRTATRRWCIIKK